MDTELDCIILSILDRLYRFMYNRTHDTYLSENLAQETVLSAYRAYPRLRDKSKIEAWLWGIARNVYMQSLKPSIETPTDEIAIIDIAGVSYDTPESEYLKKADITKIRRAVSFLAKNYRDVCVMFWLEGKDYNTISKELGIPLSSVKWRLNQSKGQLREELLRMDYMDKGYHKSIPLVFSMGGYVGKWNSESGNYDNADRALVGLLAQNICLSSYEIPKTVTEISSELGVAAEYVEDALKRLVDTKSVKQVDNKYQTMFPIWDEAAIEDIYGGNYDFVKEKSPDILELIYSLEADIRGVGFCGCQKPFDKLMLMLIGIVCMNTQGNRFETEKLPFQGIDKAWYILATTADRFNTHGGAGVSWSKYDSLNGMSDYHFHTGLFSDMRNKGSAEVLLKLYENGDCGNNNETKTYLSELIETGKVVKDNKKYVINVPIINEQEYVNVLDVLSPVISRTNELQAKLNERSYLTVKKLLPKHIVDQVEFFGTYASHCVLETTLSQCIQTKISRDMVSWYTVK